MPLARVRVVPANPSTPLRPLQRYYVGANHVRFQYGIHNSVRQRRMFGTHTDMPALVIERSEILGAGLGLKVRQDTHPGTFAAIYGEEISATRARYLSDKVAQTRLLLFTHSC